MQRFDEGSDAMRKETAAEKKLGSKPQKCILRVHKTSTSKEGVNGGICGGGYQCC